MTTLDLDLAITKARKLFNLKPYAFYKVGGKYVSSYNNLQDLIIRRTLNRAAQHETRI
jgi:hypothetical protein